MYRILVFLLVIGLYACSGNNKSDMVVGQYTTIEVNPEYDMGKVSKGEIVKVEIEVKNTGDYPLVIADIEPACSCTVPHYDEDPIAPGETSIIYAEMDTEKTGRGRISKPINITANTKPSTTKVTIIATVN